MSKALTYELLLETIGIFRSSDVRIRLERDLEPGETIDFHGRRWLVTDVKSAKPEAGVARRAIARELPEIVYD